MDDPKDKPEEQKKKPEAGAPQPGEKPKKQPRVWVKPGTTPSASEAPPGKPDNVEPGKSASPSEAEQQPLAAPGDKPKKQPKVWVKPGTASAGTSPPAPASVEPGQAQAQPPSARPTAGTQTKAEAPPKRPAKEETPLYLDISQDPLVLRLQQSFPESVLAAQSFLNQKILTINADSILPVCEFLRDDPDCEYDMLQDLTAVDYPEREKRFVVVYQLYSLRRNVQVRLKCSVADGEAIASVTPVWSAANWLEREVFDMFGIAFSGHPDLKRILLPEDWIGHPLRKDYDLRKQDEDWIRRHLQIRR